MNYSARVMLSLFFTAVLSAFSLSACQEQVFPDEIMQQIVPHCHRPSHRCVNKYWRDNVVVHIDWPILLESAAKDKKATVKRRWFRRMMVDRRLYMHDCWVFNRCFSKEFLDTALEQQRLVKLKICGAEWAKNFVHYYQQDSDVFNWQSPREEYAFTIEMYVIKCASSYGIALSTKITQHV